MKNLSINGYKFISCEDDALYVAKSKQDVLDYYKENYGSPFDLLKISDEEFLDDLVIYDLDSEYMQMKRNIKNDDNGEFTNESYYDYYEKAAREDIGCQPVLWFNI